VRVHIPAQQPVDRAKSVLGVNDVSMVLRTKESEEPISSKQESDMVGGSFHKMMKKHKRHHKGRAGSMSGGSNSGGSRHAQDKMRRLSC
jgi:hypothetical protein